MIPVCLWWSPALWGAEVSAALCLARTGHSESSPRDQRQARTLPTENVITNINLKSLEFNLKTSRRC